MFKQFRFNYSIRYSIQLLNDFVQWFITINLVDLNFCE